MTWHESEAHRSDPRESYYGCEEDEPLRKLGVMSENDDQDPDRGTENGQRARRVAENVGVHEKFLRKLEMLHNIFFGSDLLLVLVNMENLGEDGGESKPGV